jgi:DNA-binding IclR family transcriptional regulator
MSSSATRALDVLEYFGQMRCPLRAVEIARSLKLHPSSANQLLKTMVESAHLIFEATSKTYYPSPRLTRFSCWMVANYGDDDRLRRLVQHVQSSTGEVVTLTTPNDVYMQVVDLADSDVSATQLDGAERGLRVSMFGTAIGAAYLSTLPDKEILRLAYRARLPETENVSLLAWVARVRQEGFADGPSAEGAIWSLAAPLPSEGFSVPLVLGLSGPVERIRADLTHLGSLLTTTITGILLT